MRIDGRRSEAGFTLIEVIVVLVILGIVAGLVVARGPSRSAALDMRLAAGTVTQMLRLARTRAILSDRPVSVVFDTRAATMRMGDAAPRSLPAGMSVAVSSPAGLAQGAVGAVQFRPDGSSTGGEILLTNAGRRVQVGVNWLTGRVAVDGS